MNFISQSDLNIKNANLSTSIMVSTQHNKRRGKE